MRQRRTDARIKRGLYLPRLYEAVGREVIDSDGERVTYRQVSPVSLRTSQRAYDTSERFAAWVKLSGAIWQGNCCVEG